MKGLSVAIIVISVLVALVVVLYFLLAVPVRFEGGESGTHQVGWLV